MVNILHRVGIQASADKVYKALATPEGLAGWWTHDTQGDSKVGGALKFRFNDHGGRQIGCFDMRILDLQPGKGVTWQVVGGPEEWIDTKINWELKQEGDQVLVLFKHLDWKAPSEFMHHCSTKWATFMLSLKSLVETGKGAPSPHDVKIDNLN